MTKEQIHELLDRSDRAVERAILAIFQRQTHSEQLSEWTTDANGIGFNKVDAEFLSSLAKTIDKGFILSQKQLFYGRKKIKKYWKQLQQIAEEKAQTA